MEKNKLPIKPTSVKDLALGMASYTGASILGPLVIFLGLGYFLDWRFSTRPIFMIAGIFAAFLITNIFIYRKIKNLIKKFNEDDEARKKSDQ